MWMVDTGLSEKPKRIWLSALGILSTMLTVLSGWLLIELFSTTGAIKDLEHNRYYMTLRADELRQSGDDLTRFARQYIVTGDVRFLENYRKVLAIRNGTQPRPNNYHAVYWDLSPKQRAVLHADGPSESLSDAMRTLPYTETELALLTHSERNSNELVNIEVMAFNALKGKFIDDNGDYTIDRSPDPEFAKQLLFSDVYADYKGKIMVPIGSFLILVTERMHKEIALQEMKKNTIAAWLPATLLINLTFFLVTIHLSRRQLQDYHDKLKESSLRDALTGIHNRRFLMINGRHLFEVAKRYDKAFGIIMIDIDQFKKVNDRYGHPAGDTVLKHMSKYVHGNIRAADIFARIGGEEFVILLNEASYDDCLAFAESLRKGLSEAPCKFGDQNISYTVSIGVTTFRHQATFEDIFKEVDDALYRAKRDGRNCVRSAHGLDAEMDVKDDHANNKNKIEKNAIPPLRF